MKSTTTGFIRPALFLIPALILTAGCATTSGSSAQGEQAKCESCEQAHKRSQDKAPRALHPEPLVVQMVGSDEADHGTVRLIDTPNGLLLELDLKGLPEGIHAFHFHETGDCEGEFHSAGGHFNPKDKKHGIKAAEGMHDGDLPNIHVRADGTVRVDVFAPQLHLANGPHPLLDEDGAAIIIHAGADDYISDPTGDAGARLACGVVR